MIERFCAARLRRSRRGLVAAAVVWMITCMVPSQVPGEQKVVSGAIGTTTWNTAGSPYRVAGPCSVTVGQTLTITPGVDVLFDVDVPFVVRGSIVATGSVDDSVRFLPGEAPEWGGVRIIGSDGNQLLHVRISGAKGHDHGGLCAYGAGLTVDSCVISRNGSETVGGGVLAREARTAFSGCTVRGNVSGYEGGGAFIESGSAAFQGCGFTETKQRWKAEHSR